jgi:putative ATP-binding cassette transporter
VKPDFEVSRAPVRNSAPRRSLSWVLPGRTTDEFDGLTTQIKSAQQPEDNASQLKTRYLLRRFWKGAVGFWGSRSARWSWVLCGILFLIIVLNLAASYGMNVWTRVIFDALQKRDSDAVLFLSMLYLPLLAASVLIGVVQVYACMTTQRRWRQWANSPGAC